jgi:DNA modification methylase
MEEQDLFESTLDSHIVECLGKTFASDDERREYFRSELKDMMPKLKKLDGFPRGSVEDIVALSDPPYYTACPNPWLNRFVEQNAPLQADHQDAPVTPYNADVTEGKNDKMYMAHAYHTKVPYKAIMKYVLHYTDPGETVLDAFCGTGMTALACLECGDKAKVASLNMSGVVAGRRNAVISDLAPAATFIASNFAKNFSSLKVQRTLKEILDRLGRELSQYFQTRHQNGKYGVINYTIWSEVYTCPNCAFEYDYYSQAYDREHHSELKQFSCPNCGLSLSKSTGNKVWIEKIDLLTNKKRKVAKMIPVLINYTYGGKRYSKSPDVLDLQVIDRAEEESAKLGFSAQKLPDGVNTRQPKVSHGYEYLHDFFSSKNLLFLYRYIQEISKAELKDLGLFLLTASIQNSSLLYRWRANGKGGILSGTLYICSTPQENNIMHIFTRKLRDISNINSDNPNAIISTGSATEMPLSDNSIDYIFTDPPFGANINYSELNFLWEGWLNVYSNNAKEAIVNSTQHKNLNDYHNLMLDSFKEYYRVLKPEKWITIEFSNSQASVWNSIQDSIQKAGFVIANVSALDKKQGSFKAVTSTTAVKQDLVISAYKPSKQAVIDFNAENNTQESVWTFITQHLKKLVPFDGDKGEVNIISERTPRILFDRMVSYYVQNGYSVPISSSEFQQKLAEKYPTRDGMVFLDSQIAEYDKKRILVKKFSQQSLFVSDENSAIEWLRQQLMKKPQTRQELHPHFMKEIQHIAKYEELPELDELLNENFLMYHQNEVVPSQIRSYLVSAYHNLRGLDVNSPQLKAKAINRWYVPNPNKQADLEKLREKALLREFQHYADEISNSNKKLKYFRTEAIRIGFKTAWMAKDYDKILMVGEKLPEKTIQEDDKLLMYFDNASIRLGK